MHRPRLPLMARTLKNSFVLRTKELDPQTVRFLASAEMPIFEDIFVWGEQIDYGYIERNGLEVVIIAEDPFARAIQPIVGTVHLAEDSPTLKLRGTPFLTLVVCLVLLLTGIGILLIPIVIGAFMLSLSKYEGEMELFLRDQQREFERQLTEKPLDIRMAFDFDPPMVTK